MPKKQVIKLVLFAIFFVTLIILKLLTPLGKQMTSENLQLLFEPLGGWGIMLFILVFSLGIILQIPGIIFITAAVPIFGGWMGPLIAYIGSIAAVTASFYFARSIGGNALAQIKNEKIQNILIKVESNPVKTIVTLRLMMWVAPPLNYALAFTKVPVRQYIWGLSLIHI